MLTASLVPGSMRDVVLRDYGREGESRKTDILLWPPYMHVHVYLYVRTTHTERGSWERERATERERQRERIKVVNGYDGV